jgi:HK97 family phage major capsid protein
VLELAVANEQCTGFVINPVDYHRILAIKDENGGANKGSYIVGDPLGGVLTVPTLWGVPTVVSTSMPAGYFLAGNFNAAVIADRMAAVIDVSESHSDYFIKNKLAVRAEERLSLCVLRPGAFRYGSFA